MKTLLPILQEYVILAFQEFGDAQQNEARMIWQRDKQAMLEELDKSHEERVSGRIFVTRGN